jgi:hypothetical protein
VPSITRTCISATIGEFTRMYALTPYPGQAGSSARHTGRTESTAATSTARIKGMFFRLKWPFSMLYVEGRQLRYHQ